MKENEFLMWTDDGRLWCVEVFGPGQNVKVTDIMHPTGWSELVPPEAVGVTFLVNSQSTQEAKP
jgi:hypothetical protein